MAKNSKDLNEAYARLYKAQAELVAAFEDVAQLMGPMFKALNEFWANLPEESKAAIAKYQVDKKLKRVK